jgi:hypothetical protein
MAEQSASQQIDTIIKQYGGWHGDLLSHLRAVVLSAAPGIAEEVKWKKPSRPEGVAVWTQGGIICIGEMLKTAVRLTFPKGAQLNDPKSVFNTRPESKTIRAVDFRENALVDEAALRALIVQAVDLSALAERKPAKRGSADRRAT